ncbi:MAG: hypothetical protein V1775_07420 [Bacteroidota bacterium]
MNDSGDFEKANIITLHNFYNPYQKERTIRFSLNNVYLGTLMGFNTVMSSLLREAQPRPRLHIRYSRLWFSTWIG